MERQLHSGLFGENGGQTDEIPQFDTAPQMRRDPVREMEMAEMRHRLSPLERRQSKLEQTFKETQLQTNRLTQTFQRMEQKLDEFAQEMRGKHLNLTGKVSEKRASEQQISALLDRHNLLVRNFELRLSQLQKVIEEKEVQNLNSRALLDEARREIARLKRG